MSTPPVDPAACGDRIELLLEAMAAAGPVMRERAEELVRQVVELYGAGLERVLELAHDHGKLDDPMLDALAGDDLVASLLIVHGLHPYGVAERVERALVDLRVAFEASGAQVRLVEVTEDVVVRVSVRGGQGCGASASALSPQVEEAVRAAAPEVEGVVVEEESAPSGLIPVSQLTSRLHAASA